jgi:hypothetical protein
MTVNIAKRTIRSYMFTCCARRPAPPWSSGQVDTAERRKEIQAQVGGEPNTGRVRRGEVADGLDLAAELAASLFVDEVLELIDPLGDLVRMLAGQFFRLARNLPKSGIDALTPYDNYESCAHEDR